MLEKYLLLLQSLTRDGAVTGEVSLAFEVKSTNKTLIIAGSIGAVSCGPLGLRRAVSDRHAALRCTGRVASLGEPLQGLSGQVVVLTLILMGVLLYKHRDRAGEFLRSFTNFEGSPRNKHDDECGCRLCVCTQVASCSSCASSSGYGPPLQACLFGFSADARLFASL